MTYLKQARIRGKDITFPVFFPDATRGVIRSVDSRDLDQDHIEGLIVNTYHLMSQPGASVLKELGGVKKFMDWGGVIISDSGGFQLLSMIYQNSSFGTISDNGVTFLRGSKGAKNKYQFTPEKCIQMQFSINSDIMICLDDCPTLHATDQENKQSVDRTIKWAKRCKEEYLRQIEQRQLTDDTRPLLFGVIQGGADKSERRRCAEALIEVGFDGFGFGGWPLDKTGSLDFDILSYTASLMPDSFHKYALGVGDPQAIIECVKMGYNIFDCVLPTRDARHKRLYVFREPLSSLNVMTDKQITEFLYIADEKYIRDGRAISDICDCHTCKNYSRAYLNHLFEIGDSLAFRLATIHNLRTYTLLIEELRKYV